jgi:hypothetical protein
MKRIVDLASLLNILVFRLVYNQDLSLAEDLKYKQKWLITSKLSF